MALPVFPLILKSRQAEKGVNMLKRVTITQAVIRLKGIKSLVRQNQNSMDMIKIAIKHRVKFCYVLWDSWFNNSTTYKFVFSYLIPKGIHLVSMVKLSSEKYFYNNEEYNVKEILKSIKNGIV